LEPERLVREPLTAPFGRLEVIGRETRIALRGGGSGPKQAEHWYRE